MKHTILNNVGPQIIKYNIEIFAMKYDDQNM